VPGPPGFPRLWGAGGSLPSSPECPSSSSVLLSVAPLRSLTKFGGSRLCFPFSFGGCPAAGGGQLRPEGARAAPPKPRCPQHPWPLSLASPFRAPAARRPGVGAVPGVLAPHGGLDPVLAGGTGAQAGAGDGCGGVTADRCSFPSGNESLMVPSAIYFLTLTGVELALKARSGINVTRCQGGSACPAQPPGAGSH